MDGFCTAGELSVMLRESKAIILYTTGLFPSLFPYNAHLGQWGSGSQEFCVWANPTEEVIGSHVWRHSVGAICAKNAIGMEDDKVQWFVVSSVFLPFDVQTRIYSSTLESHILKIKLNQYACVPCLIFPPIFPGTANDRPVYLVSNLNSILFFTTKASGGKGLHLFYLPSYHRKSKIRYICNLR